MSQTAAIPTTDTRTSTSQAIVEAVAAEVGTDPLDLEPLYRAVDPDALDSLTADRDPRDGRSEAVVEFSYAGCDVLVSDGAIQVTERGE